MQLLAVEMLDDIVAAPDNESLPSQQLREHQPLSRHGRKTQSGKPEPFNHHELINPSRPRSA
jgi:hypothetical protein